MNRWFSQAKSRLFPPPARSQRGEPNFDDEVDVVVVGFGGAGACAALEAADTGAKVMVLDRFFGGGATAISGGVFYAGGGTNIQSEAGVADSVEDMFEYLKLEVKDAVSHDTLRKFCEESHDNLKWLQKQGVPFQASLCPYKTSYPLDLYYLYYSGNEGFSPFKEKAKPAPRGHRAIGKGLPGANFYEPLRAACERLGLDIRYESRVTQLITDEDGAVIGVEYARLPAGSAWAKTHRALAKAAIKINPYNPKLAQACRKRLKELEETYAITHRVRARGGVIISAGGFIYNRKMVEKYAPAYRPGMPLGTTGDDGSGIRMAEAVGAKLDRMDRVSAWRFVNPPLSFAQGILVNAKGERYVNESLYGAAVGEAMVETQGGKAILIIDQALYNKAKSEVGRGKAQWFQTGPALINLHLNYRKSGSIEGLAKACKMDPASLRASVDAYNSAAEGKQPDVVGKSGDFLHPIRKGPYYAIDCSITSKRFPCPTLTLGGVVVSEESGQVKDESGVLIPGLYAAGRSAVGVCSQQYVSGLSLADCVFSGRRAGRSAAESGLKQTPLAAQ